MEALLPSLASRSRGDLAFPASVARDPHPETIINPKNWLTQRLPRNRGYHETSDQPALTDFDAVGSSCRSFLRLGHALKELAAKAGSAERGWVSPEANAQP